MSRFFEDAAANGHSATLEWQGGTGTFWAWGDFGGASVALEASPDGDIWFAVGDAVSFTEKGVAAFALGPCRLRAKIAGAGEGTSISARI